MTVIFRKQKLEKCYVESERAIREFGPEVGRRFILRVNIIKSAADLEALKKQRSLRCHPLKGDREGQWAINMTDRYRLIFSLQGDDLGIVQIEEVSKHYGD